MAANTPLRLALVAVNLSLLASWAWFAADSLPLTLAAGLALVALAVEAAMWSRLTSSDQEGSQPGRSIERVAALIHRSDARRHSLREESTGLYYRWYLEMRLEQEALRCVRYQYSMAVVVLRAGAVNLSEFSADTWQAESATTAERCAKVVRNIDLSAFLAPMEYALCLIQCDRAGAEHALLRLRAELSEYTVDAGIAVYPDDGAEPLALIDLARVRSRREASTAIPSSQHIA